MADSSARKPVEVWYRLPCTNEYATSCTKAASSSGPPVPPLALASSGSPNSWAMDAKAWGNKR
eukprot:7272878-Lingulodinium_polyedra.AAC.1